MENNLHRPYLSFVMAVYNNEKYFPSAVDSVLNQTDGDWELIIVDDGSADNTPQIADEFSKLDERIRVIHQSNQWIYNSYNNGIEIATGKYTLIFNSDDKLGLETVEKLKKITNRNDYDMVSYLLEDVYCDMNQNEISTFIKGEYFCNGLDHFYDDKHTFRDNFLEIHKAGFLGYQNIIKTEIAKKNKYNVEYYSSDRLYYYQIASMINSYAIMNYIAYHYMIYRDINSGNTSSMNASRGKHYGYEMKMYDELYETAINLFQKWNKLDDVAIEYWTRIRLKNISSEVGAIRFRKMDDSLEELIRQVFYQQRSIAFMTNIDKLNYREEFESRILSGCRMLLANNELNENSDTFFVYELLDSLLRYEKDEEDYIKIDNAINNPLNRYHIGKIFRDKLK